MIFAKEWLLRYSRRRNGKANREQGKLKECERSNDGEFNHDVEMGENPQVTSTEHVERGLKKSDGRIYMIASYQIRIGSQATVVISKDAPLMLCMHRFALLKVVLTCRGRHHISLC